MPELVPDRASINGALGGDGEYFEVRATPGMTTRLRLINAGTFAPLRVSVDAHVGVVTPDSLSVVARKSRNVAMQG
ncbi:hypothetical protein B0H11DRAFT_2221444 [Mycena galericulata]|nr:hypothetical protein B0H11DRAFT_2221444 [Mycena galericulata]